MAAGCSKSKWLLRIQNGGYLAAKHVKPKRQTVTLYLKYCQRWPLSKTATAAICVEDNRNGCSNLRMLKLSLACQDGDLHLESCCIKQMVAHSSKLLQLSAQ
jgi:hypothetical protein